MLSAAFASDSVAGDTASAKGATQPKEQKPATEREAGRWRILVGDDAHRLDERVREKPEAAYDLDFYQSFAAEVGWRLG